MNCSNSNAPNFVILAMYLLLIAMMTSCTKETYLDEQPRPRPIPVVQHLNPPVQTD